MNRITYRVNCLHTNYEGNNLKALNKLGKIEDLEEELGVSAYKLLLRIKERRNEEINKEK